MMKIATKNLNRISKNLRTPGRKGSLSDDMRGERIEREKGDKVGMSPMMMRKGPLSQFAIPDTASSIYEDDFDR